MLYSLFIEPFKEGFFGIVMGIIKWILGVMLLSVCLIFAYVIIETSGTLRASSQTTIFIISDKYYTPVQTVFTPISTGKSVLKVPRNYPEKWTVVFKCEKGEDSVEVDKDFYNSVEKGMEYKAEYKTGYLSGEFYITKIIRRIE